MKHQPTILVIALSLLATLALPMLTQGQEPIDISAVPRGLYLVPESMQNPGDIELAWDPPAGAGGSALGYKLYWETNAPGEYRSYGFKYDVGDSLATHFTNATAGALYRFAVTAYTSTDNESAWSEELIMPPVMAWAGPTNLTGGHPVFTNAQEAAIFLAIYGDVGNVIFNQ